MINNTLYKHVAGYQNEVLHINMHKQCFQNIKLSKPIIVFAETSTTKSTLLPIKG